MKVFAATFAYNETFFLPRWVAYYGSQLGFENLFIIDHGSTDLSLVGLGRVNIIRVPRDSYDEVQRIEFASHFHAAMLKYYDAGFVTDVDEFVVAEPTKYRTLVEFAANTETEAPACVGLDLFHVRHSEPNFMESIPILFQRRHVLFDSWMCKRSFGRKPMRFGGGFHTSDQPVEFDENLFLIHIKNFDYSYRQVRQAVTAKWDYSSDFGAHARREAGYVDEVFDMVDKMVIEGRITYDLGFSEEIAKCEKRTVLNPSGEYDFNLNGGFRSRDIRVLPLHFRGLF